MSSCGFAAIETYPRERVNELISITLKFNSGVSTVCFVVPAVLKVICMFSECSRVMVGFL